MRVRRATVGVGAPSLRDMAAEIFEGAHAVVAVGLAGGLRATLQAGDIVVAREIRWAAAPGTRRVAQDSAESGLPPQPVGPMNAVIPADERLLSAASRAGAVVVESLLTLDRLIAQAAEKQRLAQDGDVIDMESFFIVRESAARGIPAAAVRVVGDAVGDDLPIDFARAVGADGALSPWRLLIEALRKPRSWTSLISFAVRQRRALRALAGFLDRYIEELAEDVRGACDVSRVGGPPADVT